MDQAAHKPSKQERRAMATRQQVLDKYLGGKAGGEKKFADPAAFFNNT